MSPITSQWLIFCIRPWVLSPWIASSFAAFCLLVYSLGYSVAPLTLRLLRSLGLSHYLHYLVILFYSLVAQWVMVCAMAAHEGM